LFGGDYKFTHCTFANYWSESNRQDPLFVLNNWFEADNTEFIRTLTNTEFNNCIFFGNNEEEMLLDLRDEAAQNYTFDHCLFKTEEDIAGARFVSSWKNSADPFVAPQDQDYHLNGASFAINKGNFANSIFFDLDNLPRSDNQPDLGCYEVQ